MSKTFQDRLVKELRLARIATREAANHFLEQFLPHYNRWFAVPPAQATDLHRPTPPARDVDRCLCIKATRCLRKDFTIAHAGQVYQIHDTIRTTHVQVEQRLDGSVRITHHGRALGFHAIAARPVAEAKKTPRPRRLVTPRPTHPWRTRGLPERRHHGAAAIP